MQIDLREARWFGRERAIGYAKLMAVVFVPVLVWFYFEAMGPTGSDFVQFWAASKLLLSGNPAGAYQPAAQSAVQFSLGRDHWFPFLCTPPFLMVVAPLALVSYAVALPVWVVSTYAAWLAVARRLVPGGIWPIAVYPGAMIAAWHAQNGFITGALFVGAMLTLEKRPRLSGALLGALIIKPHLALLAPVALIAGRRWPALIAAAASASALLLLSLVLFGTATFAAFFSAEAIGPGVLRQADPEALLRMTTIFAATAVVAGPKVALAVQALATLCMGAIVFWAWRRPGDVLGKASVLALAGVLATPYLYVYDLVLLIVPVCWLAREGMRTGFRAWERVALAVFYWTPFLARAFAGELWFNLTSPVILAFLWFALGRLRTMSDPPAVRAPSPAVAA